jgi:hypothetical protein
MKLLGIISVDIDVTDQILCICQILEEKWDSTSAMYRLQEDL